MTRFGGDPLVELFGGYWEEQRLWTEEFVPGYTLHRALRRQSRRRTETERLQQNWPFVTITLTGAVGTRHQDAAAQGAPAG